MHVITGRFLLIVLSLVGSLSLLEVMSRIYFWIAPPTGSVDGWVFLSERPPPYENAEYFSPEFIDEAKRSFQRGTEAKQAVLPDFDGAYIKIRAGLRHTTDQPREFDSRVLVFGASTVFSRRVPDELTIPSHLQRLVNALPGRKIRVENHGYPGNMIHQQLSRLRQAKVGRGDVVIFYDGIGDILVNLYFRRVPVRRHDERLSQSIDDVAVRRLNLAQRLMHDLRVHAGESAAVRLLFDMQRGATAGEAEDAATMHWFFDRVKVRFRNEMIASHRLVEQKGAHFYHFLQPNLFIQERRTNHEEWVVANELKSIPGVDEAFRIGYPKLREAIEQARSAGVVSFDITDAFVDRPLGEEIYFDAYHVNHVGNALAAQRIYESIFEANPGEVGMTFRGSREMGSSQ
jgi:lysophospholipase L1-like esterase